MDFAVSANTWVKIKESEKRDNITRELKKLQNIKGNFKTWWDLLLLWLLWKTTSWCWNEKLTRSETIIIIIITQENSKCKFCEEKDETINNIISECRKLAQKEYKSRWRKWFSGNCANDWSLTMQINDAYTDHNLSWKKDTQFVKKDR